MHFMLLNLSQDPIRAIDSVSYFINIVSRSVHVPDTLNFE